MEKIEIESLIDEKIAAAIEIRKKQIFKQFSIWSGALTAIFTFLVFIGFSKEEIVTKVRNTMVPNSYIVKNLLGNDDDSKQLKFNIINELKNSSLDNYPEVKASLEDNVWETIGTSDEAKITTFLKNSNIDEAIINSYYEQVNAVLFTPTPSDKEKRVSLILEAGRASQSVLIGEFTNISSAKTNCNLPFRQNKKRVILYFPPSSRTKLGDQALPWFRCPDDFPGIIVSLKIEDVEVSGIRVVGVERPTVDSGISGIRARVTREVAQAFEENGIPLGQAVNSGTMSIVDVYED